MEKERTATTTGKTRRPDLMNDPWTLALPRASCSFDLTSAPCPAGQGKKDGWKGKSKDSKDGNGKVHPRSSFPGTGMF